MVDFAFSTENILASSSEVTRVNSKGESKTITRHPSYQSNFPTDSLVQDKKKVMDTVEQAQVNEEADDTNGKFLHILFQYEKYFHWPKISTSLQI